MPPFPGPPVPAATSAGIPVSTPGNGGKPLAGFQNLAVDTAQPLTVPAGAVYALVSCTVHNVNWRDDGTAPTAAVGMPIVAGAAPIVFSAAQLAVAKFIGQAAGAFIQVSYYGPVT